MMACHDILELISASLDRPLSTDEQARLDHHLAECPECRTAQKELQWTHSQIKGLESVEPPPWLASKIMARIRAEVAPHATFWRRFIRPIVLKPQLQVASILLLAATGFYLLRSQRSEQDVIKEMKQQQLPAPSMGQPSKPEAMPEFLPPGPKNAPAEVQKPATERMDQLRSNDSKPSGYAFAPPPPPASPSTQLDLSKEEKGMARPEPVHPSETPKPSPVAGAAVGGMSSMAAESTVAPVSRAKKASPLADRQSKISEDARQKSAESAGQHMNRSEGKDKSDAVAWVIRLDMGDSNSAKALIERELVRAGATVLPRHEPDASRVLMARLNPRQLPDLLSRLARIGKVLEQPDRQPEQASEILLILRW